MLICKMKINLNYFNKYKWSQMGQEEKGLKSPKF